MTNAVRFTNNASSRLFLPVAAVDTVIRVQTGDGARFYDLVEAGDYFMVTVEDRRTGQMEIMKCTSRSGDIMTVVRAQEGTTAQAWVLGATVSSRMTAGTMNDYFNYAYDRQTSDERYVNVAGDGMDGALISFREVGEDPSVPREMAHKDYVDRRVAQIPQITISPAKSLVYIATAGQTILDLNDLDIYGQTYQLNLVYDEPVDVYVDGLRQVWDNGTGLGTFDIDRPPSQVTFSPALVGGEKIHVDVYTPKAVPVPGAISVNLLKTMVPDGVTTVFEMRRADDNSLVVALNNAEVAMYLDNVPQKPGEDYTAIGSVLTFTEAPSADSDLWGTWTKTGA